MGWLEPGPHWDGGDHAEPQWLAVLSLARGQIKKKKFYFLFMYWAALGLSCGMHHLQPSLRRANS